jgi:hypothetical protein
MLTEYREWRDSPSAGAVSPGADTAERWSAFGSPNAQKNRLLDKYFVEQPARYLNLTLHYLLCRLGV